MEAVEELTPSQEEQESERFEPKAGDRVFSRNPVTGIIESGWQVMGFDPKEKLFLLEHEATDRDGRTGIETRTQTLQELQEAYEQQKVYKSIEESIQ